VQPRRFPGFSCCCGAIIHAGLRVKRLKLLIAQLRGLPQSDRPLCFRFGAESDARAMEGFSTETLQIIVFLAVPAYKYAIGTIRG
jgi:hypothetical protein